MVAESVDRYVHTPSDPSVVTHSRRRRENTHSDDLIAVELSEMDLEELLLHRRKLIELRDDKLARLADTKQQLRLAARRAHDTGIYADRDWYRRAERARDAFARGVGRCNGALSECTRRLRTAQREKTAERSSVEARLRRQAYWHVAIEAYRQGSPTDSLKKAFGMLDIVSPGWRDEA